MNPSRLPRPAARRKRCLQPAFQAAQSRVSLSAGWRYALLIGVFALCAMRGGALSGAVRYLTFDEVREVVTEFAKSGAPVADLPNANSWPQWINACDKEIRERVDRGFEDSISNLILFGTSFTAQPRVVSAEAAVTQEGALTDAARARARDFAGALQGKLAKQTSSEARHGVGKETGNERLRFAAAFLARRNVTPTTMQSTLESNLTQFALEQRAYQETLETLGKSGNPDQLLVTRSTLFQERGLSVDTSLLPNYAIEDTLRVMLRKGALRPGSVRHIAIIGAGLDFADKRSGYDYYPLETIQPFAVLDTVFRLGLNGTEPVQLTTLDLNPAVLGHVREAAYKARAGVDYTIQLPKDVKDDWTPAAMDYWRHFGDIIGVPVTAAVVPPALKGSVIARAVAIQHGYVARMDGVDLDIVAQTMDLPQDAGYDLVVATNILVYYDLFHQALAKAAIAHMMNRGGVLLVNHALPSQPASVLEYLGRRNVSYSSAGTYGDDVVVYRRRK